MEGGGEGQIYSQRGFGGWTIVGIVTVLPAGYRKC